MNIQKYEENINSFDFGIFDILEALAFNKYKVLVIFIIVLFLLTLIYSSQDFSKKKSEISLSPSSVSSSNFLNRINLDKIEYEELYDSTQYVSLSNIVFEELAKRININYSFSDASKTNDIISLNELKNSFDKRTVDHSDIVVSFESNIQAYKKDKINIPFVRSVMEDYLDILNEEVLNIYKSKVRSQINGSVDELKELSFDITLSITALQNGLDRKKTSLKVNNNKRITEINNELDIYKNNYNKIKLENESKSSEEEKFLLRIADLQIEKSTIENADFNIYFAKEIDKIFELSYLNQFIDYIINNL